MKNLFLLKYFVHQEYSINLELEENEITGKDLAKLGIQVDQGSYKEKYFTITKHEFAGILKWSLSNNSDKGREIHVCSKSNSSKKSLVRPNESHILKNLLDEKIFFNDKNSSWDFLYFDKIKVPEKKSDDPIELDVADLQMLGDNFHELERLDDRKSEKQKKESPDQESLKEEQFLNDILNDKNILDYIDQINRIECLDKNKGEHKIKMNSEAENKKCLLKKIILDDEEEFVSNKDLKRNEQVNYLNKEDDEKLLLSESRINEILDKYNNENKNENVVDNSTPKKNNNLPNNINISNKINISINNISNSSQIPARYYQKNREDYRKSVTQFGADFNSNNKRLRFNLNHKENEIEASSGLRTKRLKKAVDNKELKIDLNTTCAICLESIKNLANLDNCAHDFCKPCIIEWSSKYTNLCPLCKKEFKKIIYYEKNKKKEMKVKKKRLVQEEDEIEFLDDFIEDSADECMVCGSGSDLPHMLVCDGCHYNVCHTYCDNLSSIPENDWFCSECKDNAIEFLTNNSITDEDDDKSFDPLHLDEFFEAFEYSEEGLNRIDRSNRSQRRNNDNSNISLNIHFNVNVNNNQHNSRERRFRNSNNTINNSSNNFTNSRNRRIR